ncbi:hypothetical protein P7F60_07810 [Rhizobium sp. YJ-22]|uniref:hypothetical protein n=1 Tax=Rhizobium sp. YJ-22 TaxID=3037556 RepID=UPI002412694C|nr:hypothetical protein [Rhizobium sp. YJ-22]MDG3576288.1 hypothetical protein [Rhizobium sp. YJ-22]
MIQYAILFGLGFLTAALIVLLLAPFVLRRVVWFTERRLRATMPISPQELRAQKDMARALYASENARIAHALKQESEKAIALQLRGDALAQDAGRLQSENADLRNLVEEMNVEAGDLRSRLRREEEAALHLKARFGDLETVLFGRNQEIETLEKRVNRLVMDIDNLKLDLAASDTTSESMQSRLASLRDERENLRRDLKLMTQRARDAEMRLDKEEHKALRLEERLMREQMLNADRETLLERRGSENKRLREKLKLSTQQARQAGRALRLAGLGDLTAEETELLDEPMPPELDPADDRIAMLAETVRSRGVSVAERLLQAKPAEDAEMREEIAAVAARMVALTALKEGEASPIPSLLSAAPPKARASRQSLADRISDVMNLPS